MARGGKRHGAGRPKGTVDEKSKQAREIAVGHGVSMINILVKLAQNPKKPDGIRVAAIREVLNRGLGKPRQEIDVDVATSHDEWIGLLDALSLSEACIPAASQKTEV